MKEFLEEYCDEYWDGGPITMRDCYNIYSSIEKYFDRTPLTYDKYRVGFYFYFLCLFRFVIRAKCIFHLMHRFGTFKVAKVQVDKRSACTKEPRFKIVWRKDGRKHARFPNQEMYFFKPTEGCAGGHFGTGSLQSWIKESYQPNEIEWYDTI